MVEVLEAVAITSIEVSAFLGFERLDDAFSRSDVGDQAQNDRRPRDEAMNDHGYEAIHGELRGSERQQPGRLLHTKAMNPELFAGRPASGIHLRTSGGRIQIPA